jgi:hypothetical protein
MDSRDALAVNEIDTKVSTILLGNCLAPVRLLLWVIRSIGNAAAQDKGEEE